MYLHCKFCENPPNGEWQKVIIVHILISEGRQTMGEWMKDLKESSQPIPPPDIHQPGDSPAMRRLKGIIPHMIEPEPSDRWNMDQVCDAVEQIRGKCVFQFRNIKIFTIYPFILPSIDLSNQPITYITPSSFPPINLIINN